MKTKEILVRLPSYAYFLLFYEEGLPSNMFLSGGRLTNFLDFAGNTSQLLILAYLTSVSLYLLSLSSSYSKGINFEKLMMYKHNNNFGN